jgi:hypothetical protein
MVRDHLVGEELVELGKLFRRKLLLVSVEPPLVRALGWELILVARPRGSGDPSPSTHDANDD